MNYYDAIIAVLGLTLLVYVVLHYRARQALAEFKAGAALHPGPRLAAMAYCGDLMGANKWTGDFTAPAYDWGSAGPEVIRQIVEAIEADCKEALQEIEETMVIGKHDERRRRIPHLQSRAAEHADLIWRTSLAADLNTPATIPYYPSGT